MRHYLGLLGIFKNEAMVLKEWLEHYIWQGVGHVWLIDNNSDDDYMAVLQPYIDGGYVTLFHEPGLYMQGTHYSNTFNKFRGECDWLLVCDVDEYLFGVRERLVDYLRGVPDGVNTVRANWLMFGSNGHDKQPVSVVQGFTRCKANHSDCKKSIGRADNITWINAHSFDMDIPIVEVTDNDGLRLNHYQVMSREYYFKVKVQRGDVAASHLDNMREETYWKDREHPEWGYNIVEDRLLADLSLSGYKKDA